MTNAENAIANLKNMKYLCETDNHGRGYGIFHVNEGDKAWIDEAIKALEREEAVLKALEDVKAEITGNLESIIGKYDSNTKPEDMPSRKFERNNGRTEAIDIINRKIAEVKGE